MYDPDNLEFGHERRRDSGIPSLKSLTIWSLIWFLSVLLFALVLFGVMGGEARAQTQGSVGSPLPVPSDRASPYPYGLSADAQTFRLSNQREIKPRQSYPAYPWTPELKPRGSLRNTKY